MVSRGDIQRLSQVHSPNGVLTVYVNIDPRLGYDRHQAEAKFKGAATRFARTADQRWLPVLDREKDRVLEYLRGLEPDGRGLAVFASAPDDLWDTFHLDVPVPSVVTVDVNPHTAILSQVIDEHPSMAVVMLAGELGRIYRAAQGRAQQAADVRTELPSRHDQGGWSQARYQRHVEFHGAQHRKKLAEALEELYNSRPFSRLVLVGVQTVTREFESMLPDPIRRRVIGHLTADFKQEEDPQILERARHLAEEDERSSEGALVDQIINSADAAGQGAV